jgi:hypothetical protein
MERFASPGKNPLQERVSSNPESLTRFLVPMLLNPQSIVHSSDSGRYLSSTPLVSSTYRPLIEPIDTNGLSLVVDDVDDVDDLKTLFSKEDEKIKMGDLVKQSDPYHEHPT